MLDLGLVVAVSVMTAAIVLLPLLRATVPFQPHLSPAQSEPMALMFEDGFLNHATQTALSRLSLNPEFLLWPDLRDRLIARFPDLPETPGTGSAGHMTVPARDPLHPGELLLEWQGTLCWVTIEDAPTSQAAETAQTDLLRSYADSVPYPAWLCSAAGEVLWENAAHSTLRAGSTEMTRTPLGVFDPDTSQRVKHAPGTGPVQHFEVNGITHPLGVLHHASRIDDLVSAEQAKRQFVQTLSKTFAHLSIGLVIFNKDGHLAIFNPALLDLTGLSPEFLSRQPSLLSFFDQLRESRLMPEPKSYTHWRQEIRDVIRAAADGKYSETWSLEDGRTYKVQGRPHPDGATAFLIEDISAEMTLTRNFRKETELSQSLLDTVTDGIVVFSATGVLTYCNAPYRALWQHEPEQTFADVTLHDALMHWHSMCTTFPDPKTFEHRAKNPSAQDQSPDMLTLHDGRHIICDLHQVAGGTTVIRFRPAQTLQQLVPPSENHKTSAD